MLVYWWWKYQLSLIQINRGFWFISRETGHPLGPGGYAIYRHSILINVLSVHPGHLTASCLQDGCSLHNAGSTEGEVWPCRLKASIITEDFIMGTAPGSRLFYSRSFRIGYIQYSTQDKTRQTLQSSEVKVQTSAEGAGFKFQRPVRDLRVDGTKEDPSHMEGTGYQYGHHRGPRGRGYWLPVQQPSFLPSPLLTKSEIPRRPKERVLTWGRQLRCSHLSCRDTGRCAAFLLHVSQGGLYWQRHLGDVLYP